MSITLLSLWLWLRSFFIISSVTIDTMRSPQAAALALCVIEDDEAGAQRKDADHRILLLARRNVGNTTGIIMNSQKWCWSGNTLVIVTITIMRKVVMKDQLMFHTIGTMIGQERPLNFPSLNVTLSQQSQS